MGIWGIGNGVGYNGITCVLALALFFSISAVLLQPSHEQAPPVVTEVEIILKPSSAFVYYNNWGIYGTGTAAGSKSLAVETLDNVGVTRVSNSKFQDLKFN